MRVRLTTDRAGRAGVQLAGEIIDLPRPEAMRLVATRQAEVIDPETMTAEPVVEKRVSPPIPQQGRKDRK